MATAQQVKELRDRTGAGVMDCKEALAASKDDVQAAVEYLRKKGLAAAAKRAGRTAREGVVSAYIHPGSKLGVLVEVNCETDFVAKTDAFQALVKDLGMQVAASNPAYVGREEVPADLLEKPFVKDATGKTKIKDLVDGVNAQTQERIVIRRFSRFQVGEAG